MPGIDDILAETVGEAIAAELAALPRGADVTADAWKAAVKNIFAAIRANAIVTIPPGAIPVTTAGGPGSGPVSPVPLSIT